MKERYIDLMENILRAYPDAHIRRYFAQVKANGLKEHGFPRLTANIGILAAHGRRLDLLPLFREMMDFCCTQIPKVKAANDFSVREIICCMRELDNSGIVEKAQLDAWRAKLASIDPTTCYTVTAKAPEDPVRNWALFSGVSEYFRQQYGLCQSQAFIDLQIASQMKWFDENGMYMDNAHSQIHQPLVYDMVARGLFCLLLHFGYSGKYHAQIDAFLKKADLLSLRMQSVSGELPFGGRSNQFLHNEAWQATIFEFEANRYAREGNWALAGAFKQAAAHACNAVEAWLKESPIRHIKNRFPTETGYGCEEYAYFDKYMITAASFFYTAYLVCDDSIPAREEASNTTDAFSLSEYFHKVFLKAGGYFAELDLHGDPHYDCSGLGRIHRMGAPSTIALSVPCPKAPLYRLDLPENIDLSICPGIFQDGTWVFATGEDAEYHCITLEKRENAAWAEFRCCIGDKNLQATYMLDAQGLTIEITGAGKLACLLPAFFFDGQTHTRMQVNEKELSIRYEGWKCRYSTDGEILNLNRMGGNRNGHYKAFCAFATEKLTIRAEICRD